MRGRLSRDDRMTFLCLAVISTIFTVIAVLVIWNPSWWSTSEAERDCLRAGGEYVRSTTDSYCLAPGVTIRP